MLSRFVVAVFLIGLLSAIFTPPAEAGERSRSARAEFMRAHPCPATGRPGGACRGWVVDHVVPLACGGIDRPENMAWQTTVDAAAKDKVELRGCRKPAGLRGM